MARRGMPYTPPRDYAKVDPARAARIAQAYEAMEHNPGHPLTHAAYDAMVRETMDQYVAAKRAGFRPEFWPSDHEDPYGPSPRLAIEDINKNNHMYVYPTRVGYGGAGAEGESDNPLLQDSGERWNGRPATVNDIFRATHDYYGHAKEGVGFRHDGEENAWRAHAAMYSPLARIAMTNETRGQNSWVNFGPHGAHNQTARGEDTVFAPQKIGHLPPWAVHEGVEDHMPPEDRARVEAAYRLLPRRGRQGGGQIQPLIAPSDVFDMSLLHETPNVPQFDLPRYEPKKGPPPRVADLIANKAVREKMHERIHKGRLVGSIWYNAEPLRREFVKAHGEEVGNRIFRRYMDYVAATSPRSQVPANARNASYYLHRDITGQGMPTGELVFKDAKGVLKKLPQPYGHKAQNLHISNARKVFSEGWDPMKNPKPRSFVENLVGNQRPGTIDAHAFKLPGILAQDPRFLATAVEDEPSIKPRQLYEAGQLPMDEAIKRATYWASKPGDPEYAAMERYYQGLGHEAGLTTAQTQASGWVGGGEETGLKSPPNMPFMTALHERVMDTAKQRNMDPRDVVQRFVRGAEPLLATGGRVGRKDGGAVDWTVPKLARHRVENGTHAVVSIDPKKFDADWRTNENSYVGPGGEGGARQRYPKFGEWLKGANQPVEMSEPYLDERGKPWFENGRHRFAYMRDQGAKSVPVVVPADQAETFRSRYRRAAGGGFPHATKPHLFHSNLGHRLHVGPIHSPVHGRTDHLPMHVPSGSYVLPADVVAHHGQDNTSAGFKVMRRLFGGAPYGQSGGPYGQGSGPYGEALQNSRGGEVRASGGRVNGAPIFKNPTRQRLEALTERSSQNHMRGMRHGDDHYWWDGAKAIHKDGADAIGIPYDYQDRLESSIRPSGDLYIGWDNHGPPPSLNPHPGPSDDELLSELQSRGGRAEDHGDAGVPIVAAGGEYVLSPEQVRAVGKGDGELGAKVLDEFVKRSRAEHIKTLKGLPGPAKD